MDVVVPLASAALLLCLLAYIAQPLMASRTRLRASASYERRRQLLERREQLFTALKELDFDLEIGKLPAPDHHQLRQPLEEEALTVLAELDRSNGHVDDETLRQRLEDDVLALRQHRPHTCSGCGATRRDEDRFCPQCGQRFSAA